MEYEGLTQDDLDNVHALNFAWLAIEGGGGDGREQLPARRLRRLTTTPFLLFTLREHDDDWWEWLLDDARQEDLFARTQAPPRAIYSLQATALAFLWGLSRRSPYIVRLVSGAPLHWCERIASVTLARALGSAAHCSFVEARLQRGSPAHTHLLRRGGSALREHRSFAQIAALQAMLTTMAGGGYERMPAAACRMVAPSRQVADDL
jgi:hypothetical protein